MAPHIIKALDARIAELTGQLAALEKARAALTQGLSAKRAPKAPKKRRRRRLTAKERAAISRRMKAAWKKRKAAKA
jgi:hypothetical protein